VASPSSSEALTRGIRVSVECRYSAEHSQPQRNQWFFLYTIRIANEGKEEVQLLSRHWIIRDATGRVEEVQGPGVVGETPVLEPGDSFEYTSGCPLTTPFGSMRGSYRMVCGDGTSFDAEIASFALSEPSMLH
jgi:ApaG protein